MCLLRDPLFPGRFPGCTISTASSTGDNSLSNLAKLPLPDLSDEVLGQSGYAGA